MKGNPVGERAVGLDREGPDPAAQGIGHHQESVIRREAHTIRQQNALMHNPLVAFGIDKPDPLVLRIAEINFTARVYRQIVRTYAFGDGVFFAIGGKSDGGRRQQA